MYTYTIQTAQPSGDTYVIEYDGDTIHGVSGPLHHTEVAAAVANPETLPDFEFDPADSLTVGGWGFPLTSYDATN